MLGLIYGRGEDVLKEITLGAETLMKTGISRNVVARDGTDKLCTLDAAHNRIFGTKKRPLIPRVRQTNNECQMCSAEMSKKTHVCLDVLIQHFHKIDESQSQKLKISKFLLKKANCV